jgi:hypothetical protein
VSDDFDRDRLDERHVIVEDETLAQGFTQIPNGVLRRSDLQPGAKLTYMVLLSYAWQKGQAFPGQDRLARDMGVSERSVITYLKQLQESGLVSIVRRGLGLTNVYVLHRIPGSEKSADQEVKDSTALEVQDLPPKKTQSKKTQKDLSKGPEPVPMISAHERRMIESYLADYARELNDQAPLASTLTRTTKLYVNSGLELIPFLNAMQEARVITQRNSGNIRKAAPEGSMTKPKMAYYLSVLESIVAE